MVRHVRAAIRPEFDDGALLRSKRLARAFDQLAKACRPRVGNAVERGGGFEVEAVRRAELALE
jgi:hypothetical protein